MFVLGSYLPAVALCIVTMLCWGSWANTQKLAGEHWRFELFYWDYAIGVLLFSLLIAFTMGSTGTAGRPFLADLAQASQGSIVSALIGGAVFNIANILLVAAIAIAGLSVAFPVGIGLALVIGVVVNYLAEPVGNALFLAIGVGLVVAAILLDAIAYRKLTSASRGLSTRGLVLSILAGISMGFFYRFVAASMSSDFINLEPGKMGPYAAVVVFSAGVFLSTFVYNSFFMRRPLVGEPVPFGRYFQGSASVHGYGVLGGAIWCLGMVFSIIASGQAGYAISYGLGQGATMVAAFWGVFVWKEFRDAPAGTNSLIALMFICFLAGLGLIISSRLF